jgi:hypothetical protein
MLKWIVIAALSGCSTPKGLEAYDSGEEPAGGTAADEATDEDADADDAAGAVGDPCEDGSGVLDCELECWADKEHLIGDGVCDDGSRGPNFFCTEFEDDRGDCPDAGGSDDGSDDDSGSGSDDDSGSGSGDDSGSGSGDASGSGSGDASGSGSGDASGSGSGDASGSGSGDDSGSGSGDDSGSGSGDDSGSGSGDDSGSGSGTATGGSDGGSPESSWDDDCGDWTLPDSSTTSWSGDTEFAGSGVPSSCSYEGHDALDASHIWNPPTPGPYCINTDGSEFDTVLSIWDADCAEELDCDADSGSTESDHGSWIGSSSQLSFTAEAGMSYVIVVDGVTASFTSYGAYTLNVVPGECG